MATLDLLDANDNLSDLQKAENSKQALEEIQTEKFYNTLKSYYSYREADPRFETMAHEDLLDYFYEEDDLFNNLKLKTTNLEEDIRTNSIMFLCKRNNLIADIIEASPL